MTLEESKTWSRDTPWRQGHILPSDCIEALQLNPEKIENLCAVVISHDCDVANDNLDAEPYVEVIIGKKLDGEGNGSFFHAKNPRILHIEAMGQDSAVIIELSATEKRSIRKTELVRYQPDATISIPSGPLKGLRTWLSIRYVRAAFADEFMNRMDEAKVNKFLDKTLKKDGKYFSKIYFDLDKGRNIDRSDGTPYQLEIILMYPPGDDPEDTMSIMDAVAEAIQNFFENKFYNSQDESWSKIELTKCYSISEEDLTVAQANSFMEWLLEYLSLREAAAEGN